jgi:hypothetical protein
MTKSYIHESMNPCVVPILLIPKNDGTWRMRVLVVEQNNNIIVKYRHYIPKIDDILDELHELHIFSKLDWKSGCH